MSDPTSATPASAGELGHQDYEPTGTDQIAERLAAITDEDAEARAAGLLAGLANYELDDEDAALLSGEFDDGTSADALRQDPVLAIVGRPNVGKSTLVNRILGRREAVVEDTPGVTRDRVQYTAEWGGRNFTLVDTGGWERDARGLDLRVAEQAEIAVEMADAVLLVVDAVVGITASDESIVRMLRKSKKPVILVGNKVDDIVQEADSAALWGLGLGEPYPCLLYTSPSPRD